MTRDTVTQAHQELRDISVAAVVAARNFSRQGKAEKVAEAIGLARDATRLRRALEYVPTAETLEGLLTVLHRVRAAEAMADHINLRRR